MFDQGKQDRLPMADASAAPAELGGRISHPDDAVCQALSVSSRQNRKLFGTAIVRTCMKILVSRAWLRADDGSAAKSTLEVALDPLPK